MKSKCGIGTKAIHGGGKGPNPLGAHEFPIFMTGSFTFKDLLEAKRAFRGEEETYVYSRIAHPNPDLVARKIALLEYGEDALMFSSGMAAVATTVMNIAHGSHVVCGRTLYGCTDDLFANLLPKLGIEFTFVDARYPENVSRAIRSNTKVVFLETPDNPTLNLADIKTISYLTHRKGNIVVAVDNSFASPYNQRPITLGADVVIHSATKYLNGHGDLISGVVVGSEEFIRKSKNSLKYWAGIFGPTPSPFECFLINRGLKTFALRMERHNSNALKLAIFFEKHPAVKTVYYPGLESHAQHDLARIQMVTENGQPGFGGMISFELKGGRRIMERFLKNVTKSEEPNSESCVDFSVSLGYAETLIQVPSLMTHALIPRKERLEKGITDGLIRISVGLEEYRDLENAFGEALDSVKV